MTVDTNVLAIRSREELLRRNSIFEAFLERKLPDSPKPATRCLAGSRQAGGSWPSEKGRRLPTPSTSGLRGRNRGSAARHRGIGSLS